MGRGGILILAGLLSGCASSYTHIEHMTVITAVGDGCQAVRGAQDRRTAEGQGDIGSGPVAAGTGALTSLLESRVSCD